MHAVSVRRVRGPGSRPRSRAASAAPARRRSSLPPARWPASRDAARCLAQTASAGRSAPGWATRRSSPLETGASSSSIRIRNCRWIDTHGSLVSPACCRPSISSGRQVDSSSTWVSKVMFDSRSIGENDPPDTERGELRPQAPQHLGPWDGQQQIDGGSAALPWCRSRSAARPGCRRGRRPRRVLWDRRRCRCATCRLASHAARRECGRRARRRER